MLYASCLKNKKEIRYLDNADEKGVFFPRRPLQQLAIGWARIYICVCVYYSVRSVTTTRTTH